MSDQDRCLRSFDLVDEKVAEADFFLEKLAEPACPFSHVRFLFSAFCAAARSITFSLQSVMAHVEGFREWYQTKQQELQDDPVARFFHEARTVIQHIGINPVSGGSLRHGADGRTELRYRLTSEREETGFVRDLDAVSACRRYLAQLVSIVQECYATFGTIIDPRLKLK